MPIQKIILSVLVSALLLLSGCVSSPDIDGRIDLLAIGNSFTGNTLAYLSDFAAADGKALNIFHADIGSSTLYTHADAARRYALDHQDPLGLLYTQNARHYSLAEVLALQSWDVVTIQESVGRAQHRDASTQSLKTLVDLIRAKSPRTRILLFEPWSPREDFSPGSGGLTSARIAYDKIHAETLRLAALFHLEILPVGTAFQNARDHTSLWRYDTPFDSGHRPAPDAIPDQTSSLNAGWSVGYDLSGNPSRVSLDAIHASPAGMYLAGAVLYEMLSGQDIRRNTFSLNSLADARASSLRALAHAAIRETRRGVRVDNP